MALAVVGPKRVSNTPRNVGGAERVLSTVGGGALALAGLRRRGVGGFALAALGAALLHRGATGRCAVYGALGVSTADDETGTDELRSEAATVNARRAVKVEQSVTIAAPRVQVYDSWRDFASHPRFMTHVSEVTPLVDGRTRYTARVAGQEIAWTSEIVRDLPGELLSWKTLEGSDMLHAGSVNFRDTADGLGTVVTLAMDYEPIGGRAGHALSRVLGIAPEQIVRDDLSRFRALMERG
jgi:uncharacterized membrane protein